MNDPYPLDGSPEAARLIERLRSTDASAGGSALEEAGRLGASVVEPLVNAMGEPDCERARAARRALWCVVDHAGRPGADDERHAVADALVRVFDQGRILLGTRREMLWMLSVIGDAAVVDMLASCLTLPELREEARCALQRMPGGRATVALRQALGRAEPDFAPAIADALRARGEVVLGRPSRRLVPMRTAPVGA